MNRWLKIGIPVVLVIILAWLFSRQLTVSVLVAPAGTGTAVNAVTGTVEVLAYIDINVKAQNRGTIVRNPVQPGQVGTSGGLSG